MPLLTRPRVLTGAEVGMKKKLVGNNFDGQDLSDTDASGQNLSCRSFQKTDLQRVVFSGCNLSHCNFKGADLRFGDLRSASLAAGTLTNAYCDNVDLTDANLQKIQAEKTRFRFTDLRRSNLADANLRGARFVGVDFSGCNLSRANLACAVFEQCRFSGADLTDAVFAYGSLCSCTLTGASGLESCRHFGPTEIGLTTLKKSGEILSEELLISFGVSSDVSNPVDCRPVRVLYSNDAATHAVSLQHSLRDHGLPAWAFCMDHGPMPLKTGPNASHVVVLSKKSLQSQWLPRFLLQNWSYEKGRFNKRMVPTAVIAPSQLQAWSYVEVERGLNLAQRVRAMLLDLYGSPEPKPREVVKTVMGVISKS